MGVYYINQDGFVVHGRCLMWLVCDGGCLRHDSPGIGIVALGGRDSIQNTKSEDCRV